MGISSDIKNTRKENEKHNIISTKRKSSTSSSKPSKDSAIIGSKSNRKSKKELLDNSKHQIDYITNAPPSSSKPTRRKSFLIASDSEEDELAEPSAQTENSKNPAATKVQKEPLKSNIPASQKTRINSKTIENIEGDLLPFRGSCSVSDSEDEVANNLEPAASKSNPSNLAAPEDNGLRNLNISGSTSLAAPTAPAVPQSSGSHSDPDEVTIIEKPSKSSRLNSDPQSGRVQQLQSPQSSQMLQSRKRRRPVRVSLYDHEPRTSESSVMKQKRSRKSDPIGYRSTISSVGVGIPPNRVANATISPTASGNKTRRTEKDGNSLEVLRKRKEEKQKHFEKNPDNQQIPQQQQQHTDGQNQASNKQQSDSNERQNITEQKQTKQQQSGETVKQKSAQQGTIKDATGADQIGEVRNRNINMKERPADYPSFRVVALSNLNREKEHESKYERNQEKVRMQHTAKNEEGEAAVRQQQFQSTGTKRIENTSHMAYHKQIVDQPHMIEDENTLNQTENGPRAYISRVENADRVASPKVDQVDVRRLFSTQVEMMNIITKTTTRNEELQQTIRDLLRKDNEKDIKIKDLEISFNEKIEEERRNNAKITETHEKYYNELNLAFDVFKQDKGTTKGVDESVAKAVHDAKEQVKLQGLRNDSFIISTISHFEKIDKNIEGLLARNISEVQRKEKGGEINSPVIRKQDALRDDFKSRLDRHNLEIRRIDQTIVSQNDSLKKRIEDLTMREQKREENDKLFRQAIDAFVTSSSRFAEDVEGVKRRMTQIQNQVSDLMYKDSYLNEKLSSIVTKVDSTSSSQSRQNDSLKNQIATHSRELRRLMLERASDADMSLKDVRDKIEFLKGRVVALDKVVNDSLRKIAIHPTYEINSIRSVSEDGM